MLTNRTFEDLVDDIGLNTVFEGTEADEAIKQLMLDWFFDYKLICDNDMKFLRYFRRRFNNLYPRYLEQVRVLTVLGNMDPYVTDYFQDIVNRTNIENSTESRTGENTGTSTSTMTAGKSTVTVRTPDLTTETQDNNTVTNNGSVINSGSDTTRTSGSDSAIKNGSESSAKTGTDTVTHDSTDTANKTGSDATVLDQDTTDNTVSKADAIGCAYPEANMAVMNVDPDAQRDIQYASEENLTASRATSTGTVDSTSTTTYNTQDSDVRHGTDETEYDTSENRSHTESDSASHNETGTTTYGSRSNTTDSTVGQNNSTTSQTGTDTTRTSNEGTDRNSTVNSSQNDELASIERNNTSEDKHEHKGRNESVADIVPRAIKAITKNNELLWFRDSMCVCFNCTNL